MSENLEDNEPRIIPPAVGNTQNEHVEPLIGTEHAPRVARFLFPIPYPFLPQYHILPFSFHILEYFSKHTEDRKAAWNFKFSPDRQ